MSILSEKWEAVGSVVRTVHNEEDGGHLFVCDTFRRRSPGAVEFNTVDAQDVAGTIAEAHNNALWTWQGGGAGV